ncbi:MAG: hypothetical protein EU530_08135 [Promethearchaeota archaeon]|nr:MAG: hypothetical protein EU530_08135 [Candidatus Lokiarchaeota archaeon]
MNLEKVLLKIDELVLDTGVIIEYFMNHQSLGILLDKHIFHPESKITLYGHNLLKSELYYVRCRKHGRESAAKFIKHIDRVMVTIGDQWLFEQAGKIKCLFPIALSDCYSISLGLLRECPVLFMPEYEIDKKTVEGINSEFGARIIVVQDL